VIAAELWAQPVPHHAAAHAPSFTSHVIAAVSLASACHELSARRLCRFWASLRPPRSPGDLLQDAQKRAGAGGAPWLLLAAVPV